MIEAILFDKDGTLFDFEATWTAPFRAFLDALATDAQYAGAAAALGFDPVSGRILPGSIAVAGTSGEIARALAVEVERTPDEVLAVMDRVGSTARQVEAVPLRPCLTALRGVGPLGLVTNDSEAPARAHLRDAGVIDLFDFIAGFDSGFGAKPGPGQLLGFAEAVGVAPGATVMVGDSRHDLVAADAAGMVPVAVLTGTAGAAELAPLAEVVLSDIGHLGRWIEARQ